MTQEKSKATTRAEKDYPGMAVNEAGDDKATKKQVDARTVFMNNNPRTGEHDPDAESPAAPADRM